MKTKESPNQTNEMRDFEGERETSVIPVKVEFVTDISVGAYSLNTCDGMLDLSTGIITLKIGPYKGRCSIHSAAIKVAIEK